MTDRSRRAHGFTLVELMVTVAVVAILAALAIPGMAMLVDRNILASRANAVNAAVRNARSDALRIGAMVELAYADGDREFLVIDPDSGDVLRRTGELRGVTITSPESVLFDAEGQLVGANDIIRITVERRDARTFCVFRTGAITRSGAEAGHDYCD